MARPGVLITVVTLMIAGLPAAAETWEGRCVEVVDGDTIRVARSDELVAVHFFGVDAPEIGQQLGRDAQRYLEQLLLDKAVTVDVVAGIAASEVSAIVTVDGQDAAEALMAEGFGWLPEEGDTRDEYAVALFIARGGEKGLWATDSPEHPEDWRARQVLPTPTPRPLKLSDVAAGYAVEKGPDGRAVIAGLKAQLTLLSDNQEAAFAFAQHMAGLRLAIDEISELYEAYRAKCEWHPEEGGSGGGTEGSVWSSDHGEWVSSTYVDTSVYSCDQLLWERDEVRKMVKKEKARAVDWARRAGVIEIDINTILNYYDLATW